MTLRRRLLGPILAVFGFVLALAVITLPLAWRSQAVLGAGACVAFLIVDRRRSRPATVLLLALAAAVSSRYLFWRLASAFDIPSFWTAPSLVLLAAETAAVIVLGRRALHAVWPLRRPPWPLPLDPQDWPAVDVVIRAGSILPAAWRAGVLAALGLDWPPDRLAVWLLDDGAPVEACAFAEAAGCRVVRRAGLPGDAPYVAVLDAGDIPTRALLQFTLGWLLARPHLAFVQADIAASGLRGVLQDGGDTLDATRFGGSGAVLRRAALRQVGGLAASDARTARRLRRQGWHGAFLPVKLAGGGAPAGRDAVTWVAGTVLLAVPMLLLLLSAERMVLLAYAVPHVGLALLTIGRLGARGRATRPPQPEPAWPVSVTLPGGAVLDGVATALTPIGATLHLPYAAEATAALGVAVAMGGEVLDIPARALASANGVTGIAWAPATLADEARIVRAVYARADTWLACAAALVFAAALPAAAQTPAGDTSVRPIPGAAADTFPATDTAVPASRTVVYTLHQLGRAGPLALRGTQPVLAVPFGVRADEVVTAATLNLEGAVSPALLPALSNVTVTLNGQYIATIPADRRTPGFTAEVPITPTLFQGGNRLEFHLAGRAQADCDDPLSPLLWATIADSSTLTLTLARLPPQRDLERLPKPFFDAGDPAAPVLPFVLPLSPDSDALRAAGIAAAWFGQQAGARASHFPVSTDLPASGNAVLIQVEASGAVLPDASPLDGPTLAVLPNPHDPLGSVLVIGGRSDAEALVAARALAFGIRALAGTQAVVQAPDVPARLPYDAPAWLPTDRPVRLGTLAGEAALQGSGYASLLQLPFRVPPDLWTWRDRPFALDLRWRTPPGPVADLAVSRLDVGLDGDFLASLPFARDGSPTAQAQVALPAYDLSGDDSLSLYFDARPLRRTACAAIPDDLRMAVDADSTLDFSRGHHIARLPDLAMFTATGFPFTRLADLSQTAIVLPEQPLLAEIGAFLDVMGRLAAQTGLPGGEVAVVRPGEVADVADRDFLVLGTLPGLQSPGLAGLLGNSPIGFADGRLHVRLGEGAPDAARAAANVSAGFAGGMAVLAGGESTLHAGRSVLALVASDAAALQDALGLTADPQQAKSFQGDLAVLSGGRVTAYRVGPRYTVGSLPFWLWPSWHLADRPWPALGLLLGGCLLLGIALAWWFAARAAARLPPRPE